MNEACEETFAETAPALCGLSNPLGQQHCFLNVCVHALWSCRAFRKRLCSEACTGVATSKREEEFDEQDTVAATKGIAEHRVEGKEVAESKIDENGGTNEARQVTLALATLFDNREGRTEDAGDPMALRVALADEYSSLGKFALEKTDDASEALEALLRSIHNE